MAQQILAYGAGWLALNKPAELSTHNATEAGSGDDAILMVKRRLAEDSSLRAQVKGEADPAPVHRLDVGTSGVLLMALNAKRARELQEALTQAEKVYAGIIRGRISEHETWNFPISDKAEGRRNPAGTEGRKDARTEVRKLQENKYFTLAEFRLHSGRTHQIRKHAAIAKHALIGDPRYGDPAYNKKIADLYGFQRMALHALALHIRIDGQTIQITSPLPTEFSQLLA